MENSKTRVKEQKILGCASERSTITLLVVLVIALILSQGFTIYLVLIKASQSVARADSLESMLNTKIDTAIKDTNSKINSLTDSITSLNSAQSDIQQQVSKIKATTSSDFSGIIEDAIKGVVTIKTDVAQGSGFIITDDGYIITNAHVLSGARYANVYTYDNQEYSAKLTGYNINMDVAVLKINGTFAKLPLGDSDSTKIGEKVIAIGNPLGLSFSTSEGIISARDRLGDNNLPYYFQTDASLNPGNSGGPLINTQGQVIGINNFKIAGGENIGFALEINHAKDTINQIALKVLNETII